MKPEQRAIIAGIVLSFALNKSMNSVFSYETSEYINISVKINNNNVDAFDYSRSCYITGHGSSRNHISLFDYGESCYIDLSIKNMKFDGFDYGSSSHFSGSVSSKSVSLYDYQTNEYYNFQA